MEGVRILVQTISGDYGPLRPGQVLEVPIDLAMQWIANGIAEPGWPEPALPTPEPVEPAPETAAKTAEPEAAEVSDGG